MTVTISRMLISARSACETRVALMRGEQLYDLDIENTSNLQRKANIYKGIVARIEPSLEAAFIDYGADRHGFLPLKEIARSCFKPGAKVDPSSSNFSIKDVIHEGQELLVQVEKEERGNKGAALTTFISLAGSYLVLMANNPKVGGVSRQIEGKERDALKETLKRLTIPEGMGIIIRTAGIGKSEEDLAWDLDMLLKRWETIDQAAKMVKAPMLIHRDDDAVVRALRDYLRYGVDEIVVDTEALYEHAKQYIEIVRPDLLPKLHLYRSSVSLFSHYRVERQIENVYQRVVKLPSGGSISIDPTEALISIDVNSARATGGADIEETALNTNLEAAEEIARQLRIRDIGGLVVIDFIDMTQLKNQRAVSQRLKEALSFDRARVKVGHITRFGLLEMSRQRIRSDLDSVSQCACPRCEGRGSIRTIESLAASVVRVVDEVAAGLQESGKERETEIQVVAPVDLSSYLSNEYRDILAEISQRLAVRVVILPSRWMETPHYEIKQIHRRGEASYMALDDKPHDEPLPPIVGSANGMLVAESSDRRKAARSEQQAVVGNGLDGIKARRNRTGGIWGGLGHIVKNFLEAIKGAAATTTDKPFEKERTVEGGRSDSNLGGRNQIRKQRVKTSSDGPNSKAAEDGNTRKARGANSGDKRHGGAAGAGERGNERAERTDRADRAEKNVQPRTRGSATPAVPTIGSAVKAEGESSSLGDENRTGSVATETEDSDKTMRRTRRVRGASVRSNRSENERADSLDEAGTDGAALGERAAKKEPAHEKGMAQGGALAEENQVATVQKQVEAGATSSSANGSNGARRTSGGAYPHMELFRSGLLGPASSKEESKQESSRSASANRSAVAASAPGAKKPLIGPVSLDPVAESVSGDKEGENRR